MTDKEFNKQFAELNAGRSFTLKGGYKVRLVGYNENNGLLIVSGHPDGREAFKRDESDVFLAWVSVLFSRLYYVKPENFVSSHEEFAEKHAGEYFRLMNKKVRVVGYCSRNSHSILVSVPKRARFGWSKYLMDGDDVLIVPSKANKFWYVDENLLKAWE